MLVMLDGLVMLLFRLTKPLSHLNIDIYYRPGVFHWKGLGTYICSWSTDTKANIRCMYWLVVHYA